MPTPTSIRPIETLREQITKLEATITVCLADPGTKAVHKLRTTTRRVEAMLVLLDLLPDLPPHRNPEKKARRSLRKLRQAAGNARDLDVQISLIKEKSSAPTKNASDHLSSILAEQRAQAEADLAHVLNKHQARLTRALEALLEALEPAKARVLTATQLAALAQGWFTNALPRRIDPDDADQLHTIRKHAKLTRYIAETAPKTARTPRKLAAAFESLQEAGGEWHDWLILSDIADNEFGDAPLTRAFRRQCKTALTRYRTHLRVIPRLNPASPSTVSVHPSA